MAKLPRNAFFARTAAAAHPRSAPAASLLATQAIHHSRPPPPTATAASVAHQPLPIRRHRPASRGRLGGIVSIDLLAASQPVASSSIPTEQPPSSGLMGPRPLSSNSSGSSTPASSSSPSPSPPPFGGSSHSSSSSGGASSSSSNSSSSYSSTSAARINLAPSTTSHDGLISSGNSSGNSTPLSSSPSSNAFAELMLLGQSASSAKAASQPAVPLRLDSASATAHACDADQHPGLAPLWARAFSVPRSRRAHYCFQHGAYGIPKRHPWAAVRGKGDVKGKQKATEADSQAAPGFSGMLAAAADFLTGSPSGSAPASAAGKQRLGSPSADEVDASGKKRGLNSQIRENGRIVQDRLGSVQVGEDAYFLRPDSLGVADGVGGWASRKGADPALFSRLLMHFCAAELARYDEATTEQLAADGGRLLAEWESVDPVEVMHTAWERCVRASRREGILGSSTALIALLRGDELRIANLGDCVLLIIRAGELLFRSTEQQHSFNFPVQLGMMGHTAESVSLAADRTLAREGYLQSGAKDDLDDEALEPLGTSRQRAAAQSRAHTAQVDGAAIGTASGGQPAAAGLDGEVEEEEAEWDEPRRDAGRWSVQVQKGDIIIIGSDGLVDNLFDEDIVEEVLRFAPPPPPPAAASASTDSQHPDGSEAGEAGSYELPATFDPQLLSEALCSRAKAVSEDSRAVSSPFQQRAMEEGLHYVGGKHDDISVVVAVVGEAPLQPAATAEMDASPPPPSPPPQRPQPSLGGATGSEGERSAAL